MNAVAPEPVTNAEFTRALGEVLRRPTVDDGARVRAAAGARRRWPTSVLLASQRAMPVRTLETGYKFRHPLLRGALRDALASARGTNPRRRSA